MAAYSTIYADMATTMSAAELEGYHTRLWTELERCGFVQLIAWARLTEDGTAQRPAINPTGFWPVRAEYGLRIWPYAKRGAEYAILRGLPPTREVRTREELGGCL